MQVNMPDPWILGVCSPISLYLHIILLPLSETVRLANRTATATAKVLFFSGKTNPGGGDCLLRVWMFFPKGHSWQLTWGEGSEKNGCSIAWWFFFLLLEPPWFITILKTILDFVLVVQESKNVEANQSRIDVVWGYCWWKTSCTTRDV